MGCIQRVMIVAIVNSLAFRLFAESGGLVSRDARSILRAAI
jgi:hypothetical protein